MTTNIPRSPGRPRGRPRKFDPDEALATAQALFQARGYDAVGVADITAALGINPPSFYAAFGSKAELFARVLDRYSRCEGIPLDAILRPDRPVEEALAHLLEDAAGRYAAANTPACEPARGGCLVLEGQRCNDPAARDAAAALNAAAIEAIRGFVAARHPERAEALTDLVVTFLTGLSASARAGLGRDRLLATAGLAAGAVRAALAG